MTWTVYKASRWPPRRYESVTLDQAGLPSFFMTTEYGQAVRACDRMSAINPVGFRPMWVPWPGQEGAALAYGDQEEHRTEPTEAW